MKFKIEYFDPSTGLPTVVERYFSDSAKASAESRCKEFAYMVSGEQWYEVTQIDELDEPDGLDTHEVNLFQPRKLTDRDIVAFHRAAELIKQSALTMSECAENMRRAMRYCSDSSLQLPRQEKPKTQVVDSKE